MQTAVVPQGTAGDYSRLAKRRSQPAPIDALFTLARRSATIYTTQDPRYVLSAVCLRLFRTFFANHTGGLPHFFTHIS